MTTTFIARWAPLARVFAIALAILSVAHGSFAQQAQKTGDWQHGTLLTGFLGAQAASSDLSGGAGAGLGWEMTRRLAFEGRAAWFPMNDKPSDFAATLAANLSLMAPRTVVPFMTFGAGMYRATFNSASTDIPDFYRQRMPEGPGTHTFQDFLMTIGGGLNVFVGSHLAIRPDASLMLVTTTSDVRPVGTIGVQFVYHIEPHPIE